MSARATVHAIRRLPPARDAEWDALVADVGAVEQSLWWNRGWEASGGTVDVIGWYADDVLQGGILVLTRPLPGLRLSTALAPRAPVLRSGDMPPAVVQGLADELIALGSDRSWIDLRLMLPRSDTFGRALTNELRNRVLRAYTIPSPSDAVVPLAGRSFDDVVAGFHKSTRRDVRAGGRRGGSVRALTQPGDLERAWRTLGASARRQGFGDVRAWATVADLLPDRVAAGDLAVLGLCLDTDVVASVVVALVGPEGYNIYSGFDDRAATLFPGHRLQTAAMAVCHARGLSGYNLGLLSQRSTPTPLDQHKMRFGAEEVRRGDRVTWERLGAVSRALASPTPRRLLRQNRATVARVLSRVRG